MERLNRFVRAGLEATAIAGVALALFVVSSAGWIHPAHAQETAPALEPAAETVEKPPVEDFSKPMGPADELNRGTPRGSMYGFIVACRNGDYERAARFLDLRRLPPEQAERGPELARRFKAVLDQTLWIDFTTLSDTNDGASGDGLPAWQDKLGQIQIEAGPVDLLLQRVPRKADGVRIWKVSAASVAMTDDLHTEFGPGMLEGWLPPVFFEVAFLEIQLWQWVGLALLALLAWAVSRVLATVLIRVLHYAFGRGAESLDERIVRVVRGPVRLAIGWLLFAFGGLMLGLPLVAREWFAAPLNAVLAVAVTWFAVRLVDLGTLFLTQRLLRTGQAGLVPALVPAQRIVKVFVVAFGGLGVLAIAGVNVTAAMAGLGVGGLAVALAAQKTIENLFGGATLFADQPVRVGDFCRFGDQVGTIEEIGLRSTRIRTLDRTVVSIPNAEFSNLHLENFAKRDRMRIYTMIGVRYETTPEQLRYLLARLRELLLEHPRITDDPARVRFVGFGAYSLDLELFAYADTADWNELLQIREDLYLRIMEAVKESGTGFAFPSSTMYLGRDEGLDEKASGAAEERVQGWRHEGVLPFPHFPDQLVREKQNTLDWPPSGSPGAAGNGSGAR
jgi:MscS family membrane protein